MLLDVLAGAMLVLSFLIPSRVRLRAMLGLFTWQSVLLTVYGVFLASVTSEWHLLITALLTFLIKVVFIPRWLYRTAVKSEAVQRVQSYLRPASAMFFAAALVAFAFYMTHSLAPIAEEGSLIVSVSVAMVLLGLLMLMIRKDMYGQIIGFLMMENGIFTFGLSLTGGMPLIVEIGVFFDVMVGSILMAALSYRVQKEHDTVLTDRLSQLVD